MKIELKTKLLNEKKCYLNNISVLNPTQIEKAQLSRAGQRRLRRETGLQQNLLAIDAAKRSLYIGKRPAEDLERVLEIFRNRQPLNLWVYKNLQESEMMYFARLGDINSLKILLKYGEKVDDPFIMKINGRNFTPIVWAAEFSQNEVVRFLASNGAAMTAIDWHSYLFNLSRIAEPPRALDCSDERLETLRYLLDHGTPVNDPLCPLLRSTLNWIPANEAEQIYKDKIIQMLLDHGAKLRP